MADEPSIDRRTFLKFAGGSAAATAVAGCSGGNQGGGGTETTTGSGTTTGSETTAGNETATSEETTSGEPESREAILQRVNQLLHDQAPWVFLNRQYSVYGVSSNVKWAGRRDERIDGYAIQPQGDTQEVVITQSQMDSGLDPHDHRETPTDNIVLQAYEGVLARDAEGKVINQLATDYTRVEDGVVEFTVREGVSFHEGGTLTAQDVAFSINRIVKEDVGGLASPQSDQLPGVTGAEAPDETTVRVTSDGINPIVFASFATYCDVMKQSWVEENDGPYINSHMNGTGPFALSNYEEGVQVVYERNEDYWSDPAPAQGLTIKSAGESSTRVNQLLSGETDIAVNVPPQDVNRVRNSNNASLTAVPSTRVLFNAMRYDVEPFSSQQFRQAMNYAIDLESIIENVLQGFAAPTGQPTLEGFTGYNSDVGPYPQDIDQAEQLVEESGHAGVSITLQTPVGRYLKDVEIAQAVANQIDQLSNVSCELEQREFQSLVGEITTGNIEDKPPFYLIGWGNATFDAAQTIIPLLTTGGALTTYENEEVDQLMERAQSMGGESSGN
ncbi:ABC transporter substrate-binding protein [Halobium palmae]|uniref:ABC transporter substrate-binding protein n=1 Tax=Halobium palmae TaxID=1776492 RepID=A0ABD5RYX0_9EURY